MFFDSNHAKIDPFLKWPGGKRWAADRITSAIRPRLTGTYYEPFLGGGAVFFRLRPQTAVLSDINAELIETYAAVRDSPDDVVSFVKRMPVSSEHYYRVRGWEPETAIQRAARLLYLNRTAFCGMYRVNSRGEFNVPFGGGQRTPAPLWEQQLVARASRALQGVAFRVDDFEEVMRHVGAGDVVYCDPTYTVTHNGNAFIRYNEKNFSWRDQNRLAKCARQACARGATVVVSNAHHPSIRALYADAVRYVLRRPSCVARDPVHRRVVSEYLCLLMPPKH